MLAKEVIVITGCSGRIGRRALQKFADPRFLVFGLDLMPPQAACGNFTFIACDISNPSEVQAAFSKIPKEISTLIHLAVYANYGPGNWPLYENINTKGTEHLLAEIKKAKVDQFIFGSSILVYRPCGVGQKIKEHWPLDPSWEYPRSLILVEEILKKNHGDMSLVLFRIGQGYDELCHSYMLSKEIQKIYEQRTSAIFFPGNPAHATSYVHFDDVADALWLTVQRRSTLPKEMPVIISESERISYGDVEGIIGRLCHGEEVKPWSIPKWLEKLGIKAFETDITEWMIDHIDLNYACDTGFAQERLGWVPRHTFKQTLPKMIGALIDNPRNWYRENGLIYPEKKH